MAQGKRKTLPSAKSAIATRCPERAIAFGAVLTKAPVWAIPKIQTEYFVLLYGKNITLCEEEPHIFNKSFRVFKVNIMTATPQYF